MEALWISDSKGLARFEAYQPQYSLVVRDIEEELVPACDLKGLGMVVWSPLAGGYLSGKYQPGERTSPAHARPRTGRSPPDSFIHTTRPYWPNCSLSPANWGAVPRRSRCAGPLSSRRSPVRSLAPGRRNNSATRLPLPAGDCPRRLTSGWSRCLLPRNATRAQWRQRWPRGATRQCARHVAREVSWLPGARVARFNRRRHFMFRAMAGVDRPCRRIPPVYTAWDRPACRHGKAGNATIHHP